MNLVFPVILAVLLILYLKERGRNKRIERDYKYINTRLSEIIHEKGNGYILLPSDMKAVKETVKNMNDLLERFYGAQIDYNRRQKTAQQVFTNISHDLRTPITVLKGYIEMLYLQSQKEELSPVMRAAIEKMQSNSQELVHSVNNLFNMAKIQSGDMILNIQKVNLIQICHEIILKFYDLLEKENFHVEVNIGDKPVYTDADTEAIQRILENLIDNAVKYGGDGKFLGVSLYEKADRIYIAVEDHGAGISEKDKNQIFTRAYTADRKRGNGLGLAIAQGLALSMGGQITAASIPHEKTVFTVSLRS